MSDLNDVLIGFFKPIRDLASSLVLYEIVTFNRVLPSTIQNSDLSFNLTFFMAIYITISLFLDAFSEARYNLRRGYVEPINSVLRVMGLFIGVFVFSGVLIAVYSIIGGSVNDAFLAAFIAAIFSFVGTLGRILHQYYIQ